MQQFTENPQNTPVETNGLTTIRMSVENLHAFLEYAGGCFELSGTVAYQFSQLEKYPSWKDEGGHNFAGMARCFAKYDVRPDARKAISVL